MDTLQSKLEDISGMTAIPRREQPKMNRVAFTFNRDAGLLALIRNSGFICQSQLITLVDKLRIMPSADVLRKRLLMYRDLKLVTAFPPVAPYRGCVYQITRAGLGALETFGIGLLSVNSDTEMMSSPLQALHCLDLNEVRISLCSDPIALAAKWYSDPEIKALRDAPDTAKPVKNYDAILEFNDQASQLIKVGIELERTFKDKTRYASIAAEISQEKQLTCVLYVASSVDLIPRLCNVLPTTTFPICVTGAGILKQERFNTPVAFKLGAGDPQQVTFRQYLALLKHRI